MWRNALMFFVVAGPEGRRSGDGPRASTEVEDARATAGANALEFAINGAVSDDGLYPSQAMMRRALGS